MSKKIYSDIKLKIGANFKKVRKAKKLSLRNVEAITGIDHSWIGKFEKGQVNFEIETLITLLSGLRLQIRDVTDFPHEFVDD